jgi:hypothetical protein
MGGPSRAEATKVFPPYPDATFIVFSDPHLYDPAAFAEGSLPTPAFAEPLKYLPGPSVEILDAALGMMSGIAADFVLVSGDLTQDGEEADHLALARRLEALRAQGKKVYVIPGNHDVEDGDARSHFFGHDIPAPSLGPEEFARIYADFGYGDSVSRAPDSLSYEAEPLPGLTLLALDDNLWKDNKPGQEPRRGGRLAPGTKAWLERRLAAADAAGRAVIVMQHHEVLEHMRGSTILIPGALVDSSESLASLYARLGARLVFTGHFHAHDAALSRRAGGFVCDASTGSLIAFPSPFRIVRLSEGKASFETRLIESIPSRPELFPAASRRAEERLVEHLVERSLARLGAWRSLSAPIARRVAEDYLAHYPGAPAPDRLWAQADSLAPFELDLSRGLLSE